MKKIYSILLLVMLLTIASCGSSKESSIPVVAYQWTVRLDNCSMASGVEATELEARNAVEKFSKLFKSKVKKSKISKVKVRVSKSKF